MKKIVVISSLFFTKREGPSAEQQKGKYWSRDPPTAKFLISAGVPQNHILFSKNNPFPNVLFIFHQDKNLTHVYRCIEILPTPRLFLKLLRTYMDKCVFT